PPPSEQQAITKALSDADSYIESLRKLIAKKRLLKQGAMQKLLTPKDNWTTKSIGEIANKIIGEGTPPRNIKEYWNGDIPWVTVKDFNSFNKHSTQESITSIGLQNSSSRIVPKGEIIIATRIGLGEISI